jgi:hypothetical protein
VDRGRFRYLFRRFPRLSQIGASPCGYRHPARHPRRLIPLTVTWRRRRQDLPLRTGGRPSYIRALRRPFPQVPPIASGGVNRHAAADSSRPAPSARRHRTPPDGSHPRAGPPLPAHGVARAEPSQRGEEGGVRLAPQQRTQGTVERHRPEHPESARPGAQPRGHVVLHSHEVG